VVAGSSPVIPTTQKKKPNSQCMNWAFLLMLN